MARVQIYNDHSSIIPIFLQTSNFLNTTDSHVKIKVEPLETETNDNENFESKTAMGKFETACDPQIMSDTKIGMRTPNEMVISNITCSTEGSSSTYLNSSKNNINNSIISSVDSIKSSNDISGQNQVDIVKDSSEIRLRKRTRSNLLECNICYIAFCDQTTLRTHISRYSKREFICHICKLSFVSPIHLTSHRRSAHRGDNWRRFKYECHYCKLGFRSKYILQQHIFHSHNINKILSTRRSRRRSKNYTNELTKSSINSEFHNSQRNKRKCDDVGMIQQMNKKMAKNTSDNEINLECEQHKNEVNDDYHADKIMFQQPSMSNYQIDNSILLNSSVKPPLVKICMIPNMVESLLNDCGDSDDSYSVSSTNSDDSNYSEMTDIINDISPKEYCLRSSAVNRCFDFGTPNRLTWNKWRVLQNRFNCRDCSVTLTRLNLPLTVNHELNTEKITDISRNNNNQSILNNSRPTVGVELQNLDLALEKLHVVQQDNHEIPCNEADNWSECIKSLSKSTNNEISSLFHTNIIEPEPTSDFLYISSLCQTRYTTKKKLLFHYLCFHTSPRYEECAICRSQYANITELTKHLMDHCIEIPYSEHEQSPIDPKGPCENSKEKYACKRCKKKFWLVSHLMNHEQSCSVADKPKLSLNNNQNNVISIEDESLTSTNSTPLNHNVNSATVNSDAAATLEFIPETSSFTKYLENKVSKHSKPPYECVACRSQFKSASKLHEHRKKFSLHRIRSYCNRCGTPFPSPSLLSGHTKATYLSEPDSYTLHCVICKQGFTEKKFLRQHMMHIHNEELKCNPVEEIPKMKLNLQKTCLVCNTIFSDRKRFIEHSMYYYEDVTIECTVCHEKFSGQYQAHGHTKIAHYSEEMRKTHVYCCQICNEGFVYPSHLNSHMYHVHNSDTQRDRTMLISTSKHDITPHGQFYMCRICNETFNTAVELSDHQLEYSNTGRYNCLKCNRKFQNTMYLEKHIKLSHAGQNNRSLTKCHFCYEVLSSRSSWLCHLKHFHRNSSITAHILSDLGLENNYPLSVSPKHSDAPLSSDSNSTAQCGPDKIIDIIEEIENNEDPRSSNPIKIEYTCALCDMKFMNSTDLKTHSLQFGNECVQNNSGNINTNFSIASIYSVELEDYENLCDAKDESINKNEINAEKLIEDNDNKKIEYGRIENKTDVQNNIEILKKFNGNICEICHTNFSTRQSLIKHQALYSNSGDYQCSTCHRKFKSIGHYQDHIRKHENRHRYGGTPMHYCKTCDEKFASGNSRNCHFAHIHGVLFKPRSSLVPYNMIRLTSARQHLRQLHQSKLDSFITRDVKNKIEKMINTNETVNNSEMDSSDINVKRALVDASNFDAITNTIVNSEPQDIRVEKLQNDTVISENQQEIANALLAILPDQLADCSTEKSTVIEEVMNDFSTDQPIEIEEVTEEIFEETEIERNDEIDEIVIIETEDAQTAKKVVDHEKNIVVEERIEEVEVASMNKNAALVLCDICGNICENKRDLIIHQKNEHHLKIFTEILSDTDGKIWSNMGVTNSKDTNEDRDKSAGNSGTIEVSATFDHTYESHDDATCTALRPIKNRKLCSKKNELECKICQSKFSDLKKLVEHLEEQHQTDSGNDNIQNPKISSSSKILNNLPKIRIDFRHVQLCCKFCGKKFTNDQYLIAHIKNAHSSIVNLELIENQRKILTTNKTKLSTEKQTDSLHENFEKTDQSQYESSNSVTFSCPNDSIKTIKRNDDSVKIRNDAVILRKVLMKNDLDMSQNLINQNSTRFPRLVPFAKNKLIIPYNRTVSRKPNQSYNDDLPR